MTVCAWRAAPGALAFLAAAVLAGCTTDAINVSDGALAENVEYHWLLGSREGERAVFSPLDEQVVLSVRFDYNLRASYEWYKVEWIDPSGNPYKVVSTRTEFGSHRDLKAAMQIRGKMAAALPGLWRVRLSHLGREDEPDRVLLSRLFRIEEMTPEMRAKAAIDTPEQAPTDRPLAGPAPGIEDASSASVPLDVPDTSLESLPATLPPPPEVAASPASRAPAPLALAPELETPLVTLEPGVLSATLDRPAAGTEVAPREEKVLFRRDWPGCPPLYYPPGEGCVEQAPQE